VTNQSRFNVYYHPPQSQIVRQSQELNAETANTLVAYASATGVVSDENYDWINGNCTAVGGTFNCNLNINLNTKLLCQMDGVGLSDINATYDLANSSTTAIRFRTYTTSASNQQNIITCEKTGADVNKSQIVYGQFEQIKSTELCEIKAYGNSGDTISGSGAEAIPWEIVLRESGCVGAWNNNGNTGANTKDNFTAPRDGWYIFSFSFRTTSSFNLDPRMTENGVDFIHLGSAANSGVTTVNTFNRLVYLTAGNNYAITIPNGGSYVLNNTNSDTNHTMHIRELGDIASIVKNLNDNKNVKCQTKYLSATFTTNGGQMADLGFSNLVIGKKYWLYSNARFGTSGSDNLAISTTNGSPSNEVCYATQGAPTGVNPSAFQVCEFTATASTLEAYAISLNAGSSVVGNGQVSGSWSRLCELPDNYIETSEF
jgi:hypothetical protein